uniref:Reverse transcriptase zinc-binding domain-containing protein n=1 Tax=Arundo donax TaxID=35708 RepID=A0A0A8XSQ3_ARUDO
MRHKVFFWLLIKDRFNTRGLLRRKNMELDSYVCELCILQREKALQHLFLRCNFARSCWQAIGVHISRAWTLCKPLRESGGNSMSPSTWK